MRTTNLSLWKLLKRIHNDEAGAVSLETILVLGVIALPILIFLIKFAWPTVKAYFNTGMTNLQGGANQAQQGN